MHQARKAIGLILLFLSVPAFAGAQVGNYWTEQFGNRSMLLSGAVIGSVSDLGLVFYNPARLSLVESPAFVLTAKVYELRKFRMEDGLGEGLDLKSSRFGGVPSLAAGAFTVPFLEGHQFAYAFLSRRREETDVYLRTERSGDLLEDFPGEEFFVGSIDGHTAMNEDWIGLTWSHTVGSRWSLGLSSFYYNLSRNADLALNLRALTEMNDVITLDRAREFHSQDQGLLWKAGAAAVFEPVSLGVTVTFPRVSVLGSGRINYEDVLSAPATAPENLQSGLATEVQKGLPVSARSPWAVGAGVGVRWRHATIHASGEWYSALPRYKVMEMEPFPAQSTGEDVEYRVVEEFKSVTNGALGVEWHRGEDFSLFVSIAANRSATPGERSSILDLGEEVNTASVRVDYLQGAGGFSVSTSRFDLTLGASFSQGTDRISRPVDFPDEGDAPVFGSGEDAKYVYSRWRFLLGFSFPFAEELRNRVRGGQSGEGPG